jgi:S1-C subfamily serine protease
MPPPAGGSWIPTPGPAAQTPGPDQSWPPPPGDDPGHWGAGNSGWSDPHGGRAYDAGQQPGNPYGAGPYDAGQQPGNPYGGGPYDAGQQPGSPYGAGPDATNPYGGGWEAEGGSYRGGAYGGGQQPPSGGYGTGPHGGGAWGSPWGGPAGGGGPGGWSSPWNAPEPPRPRRTLPGAVTALLLVVAVLVGLGLGHGVWRASTSNPQSSGGTFNPGNTFGNPFGGNGGSSSGSGSGSSGSGGPGNVGAIAAKASSSLVDINTALSYPRGAAAGTGIVLTPDGVVLTNNHVIAGATQVSATDVGNGHTYTATVVGYDRSHDIAVLQLQGAHNLTAATIGDSSSVSVGDQIVGLGNARGAGGTPSSAGGTITALDQSITASDQSDGSSEQLSGLIQVDANIQPGDSGGALVDTQGRVIGVDTAASAGFSFQTAGSQGFAIPINQASAIAHQIQSGQATDSVHIGPTAFLGVLIDAGNGNGPGASLSQAVAGGPAAQAGLGAGDTITSLAGQTVDSPSTLTKLISKYHPGDKVQVAWTDGSGQTHQATVTLATGPAQ